MKPAGQITDRAKRYRAQRNRPAGPKRCNFCASRRNVDIDHIDGDESSGEPENLMYLCRPCNAAKAVQQTRNRIGVRTRQFNPQPRPTLQRFKNAALVLIGTDPGDVGEATAFIRSIPPAKRLEFAEAIEAANRNPTPKAVPSYKQYAFGVSIHKRGARDQGGEIIHATPPAMRRLYAEKIAEVKRSRRGAVPF